MDYRDIYGSTKNAVGDFFSSVSVQVENIIPPELNDKGEPNSVVVDFVRAIDKESEQFQQDEFSRTRDLRMI